jgi:hypothetical protein
MARPTYETHEDRANELLAASRISAVLNCSPRKLPKRYIVDYVFLKDNKPVAWAEVKCRTNPRNKYDHYMISVHKVLSGMEMAKKTGSVFAVVVMWTDCIGAISISSVDEYDIIIGGRTDRGDKEDVEPVFMIPVSEFTIYDRIQDA